MSYRRMALSVILFALTHGQTATAEKLELKRFKMEIRKAVLAAFPNGRGLHNIPLRKNRISKAKNRSMTTDASRF